MTVGNLLTLAFSEARAKYAELHQAWVAISFRAGGRLPSSLLMVSIQREGDLDLLLRALEEEIATNMARSNDEGFLPHYLSMFSAYWIGGMYEIFRVLRQRKLVDDSADFEQIFSNLELIRIPLEKHELAKDRKLKEPVVLRKIPATDNDSDIYQYVSSDNGRAHIMPTAVSAITGSIMWQVSDVIKNDSYWVERRWLSDKIIELWGDKAVASPSDAVR